MSNEKLTINAKTASTRSSKVSRSIAMKEGTRINSPKYHQYTESDMIDVYNLGMNIGEDIGYQRGVKQVQDIVQDKVKNDLKETAKITQIIIEYLKSMQMKIEDAYLRINNPGDYEFVLFIKATDFEIDKIIKAYNYISIQKNEHQKERFYFSVSLVSSEENFNFEMFKSDGFTYKYGLSDE